jgi:hypothetical protein
MTCVPVWAQDLWTNTFDLWAYTFGTTEATFTGLLAGPDPISGKHFSRIVSLISSACKRHGFILERNSRAT